MVRQYDRYVFRLHLEFKKYLVQYKLAHVCALGDLLTEVGADTAKNAQIYQAVANVV